MSRALCAQAAAQLAAALGLTEMPLDPKPTDTKVLTFLRLIFDAAPPDLYQHSAHAQLELKRIQNAIIAGKLDELPDELQIAAPKT